LVIVKLDVNVKEAAAEAAASGQPCTSAAQGAVQLMLTNLYLLQAQVSSLHMNAG
jgi:hypothetical protein